MSPSQYIESRNLNAKFSSGSRMARAKPRTAFTLVELLVVIAIIGILVGLLLPAVQAAREAARRASCANNLLQLGLAVHHHEFSVEHLPAGVLNADGPVRNEAQGQHVSWIVQILPFIEEQAAYQLFDQQLGAYAPANERVRNHYMPILLCPSDPVNISGELQPSTYVGCHHDREAPIDADNNGLLFLNSQVRFRDILDGSSHTILLGESFVGADDLGWVSGTRATLRNTGSFEKVHPANAVAGAAVADATDALQVGGFGSFHVGGGNFVFADGSIRFLSENTDVLLFQHFGNRADGEMLEVK